jgi:hypothetical protein
MTGFIGKKGIVLEIFNIKTFQSHMIRTEYNKKEEGCGGKIIHRSHCNEGLIRQQLFIKAINIIYL